MPGQAWRFKLNSSALWSCCLTPTCFFLPGSFSFPKAYWCLPAPETFLVPCRVFSGTCCTLGQFAFFGFLGDVSFLGGSLGTYFGPFPGPLWALEALGRSLRPILELQGFVRKILSEPLIGDKGARWGWFEPPRGEKGVQWV